jgi:peptidoglycan/xylan/chitin deacetylase (PgdA/CDA1 family)
LIYVYKQLKIINDFNNNDMNSNAITHKILITGILKIFIVGITYSQVSIGQTEITKWQYGKKGAVSITYDDGTINQFRVAVPIMNRLDLPGTFYINTGTLPNSTYLPKFIGRPVSKLIEESKTIPANADNVFERASAARYLGFRGTESYFNRAGSAINSGRMEQAYAILDELYKKVANGELEPLAPNEYDMEYMRNTTEDILTWDMVKTHASEGHEFASHKVTHPYVAALDDANLKYELEKSRKEILKKIGIRHTLTSELPYGTQNERAIQAALKVFPVLRNRIAEDYVLELHRPNRQTPVNDAYEYVFWERGILSNTTLAEMNGWVDLTASQDNIWLVTVIHGIDGIGWEPLTNQTVDTHFTYIKAKENDLWVATFADAARYIKQRMNTKVTSLQKGEKIYVKLTNQLNKKLYAIPLTLKTYVSPEWKESTVKQGKSIAKSTVHREGSTAFIIYQAMPGKGIVEIIAVN